MNNPQKIIRLKNPTAIKVLAMNRATVITGKGVLCYHMVLCSGERALVDTKNLVNTSTQVFLGESDTHCRFE